MSLCLDIYELISFKLALMIDITEFYSLTLALVTLMFTQGHRGIRKPELLPSTCREVRLIQIWFGDMLFKQFSFETQSTLGYMTILRRKQPHLGEFVLKKIKKLEYWRLFGTWYVYLKCPFSLLNHQHSMQAQKTVKMDPSCDGPQL